jgi:uncharacterized protein YbjT (DUF2867 family)
MKILVSGATGYIGSKLVERLVASGHEITCMVRDVVRVTSAHQGARIVIADCLQPQSLTCAMEGIDVAYYLVHSMSAGSSDFRQRDVHAARNFAVAAREAGVRRIIYLGGLASENSHVSAHLRSRHETGEVLREFGPAMTEFRAGIIVGNGSVSFELVRYLTERLPVMICPRWVVTATQPIAIDDTLDYLAAALDCPESIGKVVEIGGATVETYRSMMLKYAQARGLRRYLLRVPVLTPRLSSYWLRLVTPIPTSISRPLVEGLRTEVVCRSSQASQLFPAIRPMSYPDAVAKTLARTLPDETLTENLPSHPTHIAMRREGILCDVRQKVTPASIGDVFAVITELGGSNGYLYGNVLWRVRGWMDRMLGGVGLRHSRKDAGLSRGDHFDFWCVQDLVPGERLLLRAEMKVPGCAWLEFHVLPHPVGGTLVRCCAWFEPRGLLGELYWWILYPIHVMIFRGMVEAICKKASHKLPIDAALAVR